MAALNSRTLQNVDKSEKRPLLLEGSKDIRHYNTSAIASRHYSLYKMHVLLFSFISEIPGKKKDKEYTMSLEINWPSFDKATMEEYRAQLTKMVNQGPFPPQICDAITVTEIDVGKIVSTPFPD